MSYQATTIPNQTIPNMKTIQVYDPPMCCSTGICGTDIDPDLVNFAAMLSQLGTHGIKVERYNLGQQPMAFVQNPPDGNGPEVATRLVRQMS